MIIVNFGHFTVVNPDSHILYYENEDGLDWYELRAGLTSWVLESGDFADAVFGAFATVDDNGVVRNVEYNPSKLVPDNRTVLGIDADWKDIQPGMRWTGEKLLKPTKASLEILGPPLQRIRN